MTSLHKLFNTLRRQMDEWSYDFIKATGGAVPEPGIDPDAPSILAGTIVAATSRDYMIIRDALYETLGQDTVKIWATGGRVDFLADSVTRQQEKSMLARLTREGLDISNTNTSTSRGVGPDSTGYVIQSQAALPGRQACYIPKELKF